MKNKKLFIILVTITLILIVVFSITCLIISKSKPSDWKWIKLYANATHLVGKIEIPKMWIVTEKQYDDNSNVIIFSDIPVDQNGCIKYFVGCTNFEDENTSSNSDPLLKLFGIDYNPLIKCKVSGITSNEAEYNYGASIKIYGKEAKANIITTLGVPQSWLCLVSLNNVIDLPMLKKIANSFDTDYQ